MIERYRASAGSFAQIGSFGFLTNAIERAPLVRPGALRRAMLMIVGSIETDAMYSCGFQPSLFAATTAWIMNFGVAKSISVSAPEAFSLATWAETSDAVNSYASDATTRGPLPAIARERPRAMSRPRSV